MAVLGIEYERSSNKIVSLILLIVTFIASAKGFAEPEIFSEENEAQEFLFRVMAELANNDGYHRGISGVLSNYTEGSAGFNESLVEPETWRKLRLIQFHIANQYFPNEQSQKEIYYVRNKLGKIYSAAKVCDMPSNFSEPKCYNLDPDLGMIFKHNRSYDTLLWHWTNYRKYFAENMQIKDFKTLINRSNARYHGLGFEDYGDFNRQSFFLEDVKKVVEDLYEAVEPLYQSFHAYTRGRLRDIYGGERVDMQGPIPAHILGDINAAVWYGLVEDLTPCPDADQVEITSAFNEQNLTAIDMVKMADEFFVDLGLKAAPKFFWDFSQFERRKFGVSRCHGGASDLTMDGDFVYITMCIDANAIDFIILHHEMGHIQYFMQYANQSVLYRGGANPAFHEAVGDTIALSVLTQKHLQGVGLKENVSNRSNETSLNFLMANALWTIPRLPYGKTLTEWQWGVYDGSIGEDEFNTEWWNLRNHYQGIAPPVARSKNDKDYLTSFHVSVGMTYDRYFLACILSFQFYEALCNISGHEGPLHECDFGGSLEAGKALGKLLEIGTAKPWQDTLESLTGQRSISADSFLRYFAPLSDWLEKTNKENRNVPGWSKSQRKKVEPSSERSVDPETDNGRSCAGKFVTSSLLIFTGCLLQGRII